MTEKHFEIEPYLEVVGNVLFGSYFGEASPISMNSEYFGETAQIYRLIGTFTGRTLNLMNELKLASNVINIAFI